MLKAQIASNRIPMLVTVPMTIDKMKGSKGNEIPNSNSINWDINGITRVRILLAWFPTYSDNIAEPATDFIKTPNNDPKEQVTASAKKTVRTESTS